MREWANAWPRIECRTGDRQAWATTTGRSLQVLGGEAQRPARAVRVVVAGYTGPSLATAPAGPTSSGRSAWCSRLDAVDPSTIRSAGPRRACRTRPGPRRAPAPGCAEFATRCGRSASSRVAPSPAGRAQLGARWPRRRARALLGLRAHALDALAHHRVRQRGARERAGLERRRRRVDGHDGGLGAGEEARRQRAIAAPARRPSRRSRRAVGSSALQQRRELFVGAVLGHPGLGPEPAGARGERGVVDRRR